jgi:ethanolamine utilization protein EutQ (cupin superfamily)
MWAELPRTINLEIDIKKRTEEHIAKQMRMVMKGKLQKEKTAADPNIKREYVDINRQEVDVTLKPKAVMKNGGLMLDKITNQNQKEWCQENVFDEIRVVIKLLISHI